jgi:FAD/FMN-containing dehydrogenase
MTRNWVAGLQVVTGSGELLDLGRALLKDNSGGELQQIFIGSEGTLGIITEATMRLTRVPAEPTVMVLGLRGIDDLLPVLQAFQSRMVLNAFEFFTEEALSRVVQRHDLQRPFESATPVYALLEFEATSEGDMDAALAVYEACSAQSWVLDGTISHNKRQAAELWRLRENISETLSHFSPYKNDLSVRVSQVPGFLDAVGTVVADRYPDFEVLWYGHIGDGNVHLNILKPANMAIEAFKAHCADVSKALFEVVRRFGGSISAEHGVGLLKRPYLGYTRSAQEIAAMKAVKAVFDPNGVLSPGKVFA